MAFFEQIGKHITGAGQNVAQQTKNFADVTQLGNTISANQKKISQLYLVIGEAYYEKHKEDTSAEVYEKIQEVNLLFDEIAKCNEKIKQIKGIDKCPNCGADVPIHAMFCNACGVKMVRAENNEQNGMIHRYCPCCGTSVAESDLFCNFCGTKMENIQGK